MTCEEQLAEWVKGNPIHNTGRDECCPDFSCCQPELLAPLEVREKFAKADDEARMGFLMHFMGAAVSKASELSATKPKVYISGEGSKQ